MIARIALPSRSDGRSSPRRVLDAERLALERPIQLPRSGPASALGRELLGLDLEAPVAVPSDGRAAARMICAPPEAEVARPASGRRSIATPAAGVVNVICVPPSKSMPRLRPLIRERARARSRRRRPRSRTSSCRMPMKSTCSQFGGYRRRGAHQLGLSNQREAGEQAEQRARRSDRGQHRDQRSDQEHQREALHARGRDREEHERRDRGDDVRVDDRVEALARSRPRSRRAPICPRAYSSFTRSKMTTFASAATPSVRIEPGEARQGQRDVEEQDRGVEERRVDAEADHRDEAEQAVEEEQEERDDEQADERGLPRLA